MQPTHSYFGHNEWASCAPGLKTVSDALEIRRRIFLAYEAAERESDEQKQKEWLTFTVIGGGPTGVELAGALAEIGFQTLAKEFRRIDPRQVRVLLIEGKVRILSSYSPDMSRKAERQLKKLGVEVITNSLVSDLYVKKRVGWFRASRSMFRAACIPSWIAAGAIPGTIPSPNSTRARSPATNT